MSDLARPKDQCVCPLSGDIPGHFATTGHSYTTRGRQTLRADREAVLERLSALVQRGADVLGTGDRFQVDVGPFQGWRAQAISTLTRTLGPGDTYLVAFEKAASDTYRES